MVAGDHWITQRRQDVESSNVRLMLVLYQLTLVVRTDDGGHVISVENIGDKFLQPCRRMGVIVS
jgi:hypothetical protein